MKRRIHDKHKLGQSNQQSAFHQAWKSILRYRNIKHSNAFMDMPKITESIKVTIDKCRNGTLGNNKWLNMMGLVNQTSCPMCPLEDSRTHDGWMHTC